MLKTVAMRRGPLKKIQARRENNSTIKSNGEDSCVVHPIVSQEASVAVHAKHDALQVSGFE